MNERDPKTPPFRSPIVGPAGTPTRLSNVPRTAAFSPGETILGQWTVESELGRGGFGVVYQVRDESLGVSQALKVLDAAMMRQPDLLARFRREVSLMRSLVHERVVRVFDYREDLDQSLAVVSMELVHGGSLRTLLDLFAPPRQVGEALARKVLTQVLEGLAEAHRRGVIHRDVTPANILLSGVSAAELAEDQGLDPKLKLVDFGLAGLVGGSDLSRKSRVMGTAAYVAPEVVDPKAEATPAVDVYGAAAVIYELLTGRLAYGRFPEPRELRTDLDPRLSELLLEMLDVDPQRRPSAESCLERLEVLDGARLGVDRPAVPLRGKGTSGRLPLAPANTDDGGSSRHPLRWLVAAVGLVVFLTLGLWIRREWSEGQQAEQARQETERLAETAVKALNAAMTAGDEAAVQARLDDSSSVPGAAVETSRITARQWLAARAKEREVEAERQRARQVDAIVAAVRLAVAGGDEATVQAQVADHGDSQEPLVRVAVAEANTWLEAQERDRQQAATRARDALASQQREAAARAEQQRLAEELRRANDAAAAAARKADQQRAADQARQAEVERQRLAAEEAKASREEQAREDERQREEEREEARQRAEEREARRRIAHTCATPYGNCPLGVELEKGDVCTCYWPNGSWASGQAY